MAGYYGGAFIVKDLCDSDEDDDSDDDVPRAQLLPKPDRLKQVISSLDPDIMVIQSVNLDYSFRDTAFLEM